GRIPLYFMSWRPNRPDIWEEALRRFTRAHPEVELIREIGPHSSTAYHDLLSQKLKNADAALDVFFMDVIWPPEFAAAGWALPLDGRFPPAEQARYLSGPLRANRYRGRVYGVPFRADAGLLYYRKDLLAQYGFEPPRTWEELVRQARVILKGERGRRPALRGYSGQFKQYEGLVCDMLEFIHSRGGALVDEEGARSRIAEVPALEAIRFVRDSIIGGIGSSALLTYQEPESLALFVQGNAIFHRNWPYAWAIANDPARSRVAGRVGMAPLPHFEGGKSFSTLGGWAMGISRYSRHPDLAWKFTRFMTSPEIQRIFALRGGFAPTRRELYEDPEVLARLPHMRQLYGILEAATPRPRTPLYPRVSFALQLFFSRALSSRREDLGALARRAGAEVEAALALAARPGGESDGPRRGRP
ncbi:MAG: ABC transporter substrate-binding protein, partial [Nitrospinota bacterium]